MTAAIGSDLTDIAQRAVDHCPVSDAMKRAIPTRVEVNS